MAIVAGMLGALVGFVVGVVFTEIVFANNADWPNIVPFVLAVVGWLAARELLRHRRSRKPGARAALGDALSSRTPQETSA